MGFLDVLASLFVAKPSNDSALPPTPIPQVSDTIDKQVEKPVVEPTRVPSACKIIPPQDTVLLQTPEPLRCPYCSIEIIDPPKKKKKCSSCGQPMCVRRLPSGNVRLFTEEQAKSLCTRTLRTGERVLVTQQEALDIDSQLFRASEMRMAERWIKDLGFSISDYEARCDQTKSQGRPVQWRDVIWSMCNERMQHLISTRSYYEMKGLYCDMARFCHEDKRDCTHLLREAERAGLMLYKSQGVERVEFIAGHCKACKKLDRKVFAIDVALKAMPLPPAACTCNKLDDYDLPYCASTWAGVV